MKKPGKPVILMLETVVPAVCLGLLWHYGGAKGTFTVRNRGFYSSCLPTQGRRRFIYISSQNLNQKYLPIIPGPTSSGSYRQIERELEACPRPRN